VPHYDGVITDELFIEGMDSIESQTFRDFEVLIYHDGPLSRPLPDMSKYTFNYTFKETKKRYNDWGHSLRDLGIKEATGEYIVHFNPDNILFPEALQDINMYTDYSLGSYFRQIVKERFPIVVCPIILEGTLCLSNQGDVHASLYRTFEKNHSVILTGSPPIMNNVDCMQVVMLRKLWLEIGGWYDKTEKSDGLIYQEVCKKKHWVNTWKLMGVHR
jgi:hypothetical protein